MSHLIISHSKKHSYNGKKQKKRQRKTNVNKSELPDTLCHGHTM